MLTLPTSWVKSGARLVLVASWRVCVCVLIACRTIAASDLLYGGGWGTDWSAAGLIHHKPIRRVNMRSVDEFHSGHFCVHVQRSGYLFNWGSQFSVSVPSSEEGGEALRLPSPVPH